MWECCSSCAGPGCRLNRVVSGGIKLPLEVFKSAGKGWGLRCAGDGKSWLFGLHGGCPAGVMKLVHAGHARGACMHIRCVGHSLNPRLAESECLDCCWACEAAFIPAGTFIVTYEGELLTSSAAVRSAALPWFLWQSRSACMRSHFVCSPTVRGRCV